MAKKCILILGGARSGKSIFAQELAKKLGGKVLFIATSEALDDEMKMRIEQHRRDRPQDWQTLETPSNLGSQIERHIGGAAVAVIDCITLLVSNLLGDGSDYAQAELRVTAEMDTLIASMHKLDANFIIVSNEVGMGIVPGNKTARIYRDLLGKANQLLARYSNEVYLMVAGIPFKVK